ncbi:gamma-glutamate kinase [Candidatus Desulfarcum epimagneticum]|uniref:Glutamate 5-kinase n=1 Tax=uncultured Desulfobacteraceae bacterium TaxID=218296 RepID=A0A484HJD1_9BACT|nr:gamma-glutamate kinase [uncultured Desulfobacteraceae bacterium]
MNETEFKYYRQTRRAVVKIGSRALTEKNGLNLGLIGSMAGQISRLWENGVEVILVSSGALAAGMKKVGLSERPDEIPKRQAAAAVGQAGLIMEYEKAFESHGRKVAQVLLTGSDLNSRKRYLNARNTIHTLLSWKIVPIINENDTVAVDEIKFGDNDNLSAMIAMLMDADILINLTDTDGLHTRDPRQGDAELIPTVEKITPKIEKLAGAMPGSLGAGGMSAKIKAAKKLASAAVPMTIANAFEQDILRKLFSGQKRGTFFVPKIKKLASRKCWIAYSTKPKGAVTIDEGAARAIIERGKSLLPSGVTGVMGNFNVGAPVEFATGENRTLGVGLVNYSSAHIQKIMGLKTGVIADILGSKPYDEVIHRDNLVITDEC